MHIAIITARGGSKRIPRKNIRLFLGKPMIAWPIAAALASGCFAHVLVSTDDEEIAEIARQYGAEAPFLRPAELADDFTHAHKAARHMLEWAMEQWGNIPAFAHIYPTAPMLTPEVIRAGQTRIQDGKRFVYAAQRVGFPIYQVVVTDEQGNIIPLFSPEKAAMRSQDMPAAFIDAGQLYWFDTAAFLKDETSISEGVDLIAIPAERALDIDTEEDWRLAEKLATAVGACDADYPSR